MPQITLTLPDSLYRPVRRLARTSHKPIEKVLLTALHSSLPPLDDLPSSLAKELIDLETQGNKKLRQVLLETVPPDQQEMLDSLLYRNQLGDLPSAEKKQLSDIQRVADRVMLRKARAAVLLRFRGERLPTLPELRQQTITEQ
ncbi:hypothetical protein H8E88_24005 [candidate division KSB1 bacterium]|nr:hypothetical protein [candidate division KSB1 bacterium]MBL7093379.1 hypothetical protein [candidate division KSB1 bacterium]